MLQAHHVHSPPHSLNLVALPLRSFLPQHFPNFMAPSFTLYHYLHVHKILKVPPEVHIHHPPPPTIAEPGGIITRLNDFLANGIFQSWDSNSTCSYTFMTLLPSVRNFNHYYLCFIFLLPLHYLRGLCCHLCLEIFRPNACINPIKFCSFFNKKYHVLAQLPPSPGATSTARVQNPALSFCFSSLKLVVDF